MAMLVKDIMSTPVIKIDQEKTIMDAAKAMGKARIGCIIITRMGKPVGIVTDSDMVKKIVAKNLRGSKIKVKEVMSSPLITVRPDDDVTTAIRKIKKNNISRVPVVEGGKVVGILSITDIAGTSQEMLDLLEYRIRMKEIPTRIVEEFATGICELCGNYTDALRNVNDQWICENCKDILIAEEGR